MYGKIIVQRNASKFAIFYIYENTKLLFLNGGGLGPTSSRPGKEGHPDFENVQLKYFMHILYMCIKRLMSKKRLEAS